MNLTRFPGLSLRDNAYMQAAGGGPAAPITPADPNTTFWYKADEHITRNSYIGDKMDTTVNKASSVNPNMNLVRFAGTPLYPRPTLDNNANFCQYSENLQIGHTVASFTINSPTLGTFTAQNGYIRSQLWWCGDEPGVTYVFKFKVRAVTGNTNLHVYHVGSATGASTPVAVTGVLTEYTVEFLGPAAPTAAFYVGIQDQNAGGHGQIETTEWHLYRKNEHDTAYVQNTDTPSWPYRLGYSAWQGWVGTSGGFNQPGSFRTHPGDPIMLYFSAYLRNVAGSGWTVLCNRPGFYTWGVNINLANSRMRIHGAGAWSGDHPTVIGPGAWHVFTVLFNAGASIIRVDNGAAFAAGVNAVGNNDRTQIGFDSASGGGARFDFHELILRTTADNAALQDQFITYLGANVGLTI